MSGCQQLARQKLVKSSASHRSGTQARGLCAHGASNHSEWWSGCQQLQWDQGSDPCVYGAGTWSEWGCASEHHI